VDPSSAVVGGHPDRLVALHVTRAVRVSVLALAGAAVVFVGILVAAAAGNLSRPITCAPPDNRLVDATMVVTCVCAFFLGRFLVDRRDQSADKLVESRDNRATGARSLLASDPPAARRGALIAHVALALFFAGGVAALAYETVAVWSDNAFGFQTITYYVRCAKGSNWPLMLLASATVSFFVGHWLWFPMTRRDG
jgi:hypothetical protein